jgi:predicted RND superfamily exporter protein
MKRFAEFIVGHQKFIIAMYVCAIIFSLIGMRFVSVEYDLGSYLPGSMSSIKGKEKLESEFQINGMASLMIKNKDLYSVKELKEKIKEMPGVEEVVWLDSVEDINKPAEFFDEKLTERFARGDFSLLQIQFKEGNESIATREALDRIDEMVAEEHYLGGPAAVSKDMMDTTSRELWLYSAVAFIIITIILVISSEAYYEPILFFMTIGVAIILNMGTNMFFGKISSMTNSVSSILQLAVSMDYSIFLLHRFHEEKKNRDKKEAMVIAIQKSFSSVSASAMTTVSGFLALTFMKYGIGRDMGFVLAKGVFFSLIAVMTLMPVLILKLDERFNKYKHKIFLPDFNKNSRKLAAIRNIAVVFALILTIPAFLGQSKLKYYYSNEKTLSENSRSAMDNRKIEEIFGKSNEAVLIVPKGDKVRINSLINELKSKDKVDTVQGLYSMVDEYLPDLIIPKEAKDAFESDKYTYFAVNLLTGVEGEEASKILDEIENIAGKYYDEWYLTGQAVVYKDLQQVTSKDFSVVNIISIILIGLILLLTFKSILIPLLLIFVIQLGIWINLSIPYFQASSINFISFIIIGAIQLGATVDYAILFTSRYKENLAEMSPIEAAVKTIGDTGRSVLTSALILIAGTFSISFITTIRTTAELTLMIGRGSLISLVLVFTLLPGVLVIFDTLIKFTTKGWPKSYKSLRMGSESVNE